jgi:DEAD/DEAH box helicase domain-containing protein
MAHLLRRLQRLARHYGAQPQYLLTSAPLGNMADVARTLTAHACTVVAGEARRAQTQSRVVLESDADPVMLCRELIVRHREAGLQPLILAPRTLDLTPSPSDSLISLAVCQAPMTREAYQTAELRVLRGECAALVLPHETSVATVRPSALPSIIFLGIPASLTRLHEYLSLLASSHTHSVSTLVLSGRTALERYLLHYPAVYQSRWLQHLALYPSNAPIARQHLTCAAAELALGAGERYPGIQGVDGLLLQLADEKAVTRHTASGAWVATQRWPHRRVHLRSYEPAVAVINLIDGGLVTRLTQARAYRACFAGAVLTHNGRVYHVERQSEDRRRVFVRPAQVDYLTRGTVNTTVTEKSVAASVSQDACRLTHGTCVYTEALRAYERLEAQTRERQSVHILPTSRRTFSTQGVWIGFPGTTPPQHTALHTLVHAVCTGLPLLLLGETNDIRGGVYEPQGEGLEATFVDAHPGGNGVSGFMYRAYERVWRAGLQVLLHCACSHGCSRCVAAYQCDTCASGAALDRQAGIQLLQRLLGEVVPTFESLTAEPLPRPDRRSRQMYLSLSTQKSAEEVGGWQHKHLLGLGVAVTYDTQAGRYQVYTAETVDALLASLRDADLVVGFNTRDFDYQVLQPYTDTPLTTLPTLAVLDEIHQALGFRLSLRHLVKETLGLDRPDDSIRTLHWYQEGDRERIAQQCRRDIDLVQALVRHGTETGTIFYRDHAGARQADQVRWQLVEHHG